MRRVLIATPRFDGDVCTGRRVVELQTGENGYAGRMVQKVRAAAKFARLAVRGGAASAR